MDFFISNVLGKFGVIGIIGLLFFFYSYKNSIKLFAWIEDQTYGTRDYILKRCELIFVEVKPEHVTYALVGVTIGLPVLVFAIFSLFGKYFVGSIFAGLISLIGWKGPRPLIDLMVERRIDQYRLQMVDALTLLSNGLRAGLSVPQSIQMVVDELPNPISQEFNLILQQNKIGVPLEECFDNLNKRVPTEDNEMFVTSVNILRETGGNLAEVFDTITQVIRERVRLQQKIDTFVAQGKFQGGTIFMMPFAMLMIFSATDPKSVEPLFSTIIGNIFLIAAFGLDLLGGYVILKIVKIKV
jgi:tight adherence protein B